jgi:Mg-chelatase subunit ChlD
MKIFLILIFATPLTFLGQDRNEKVRNLNSIITMMDVAGYLNQSYYNDVKQLAKAVEMSKDEISENYFYCSNKKNVRVMYTDMDKAFRFKELQPDKEGYLTSFESDKIGYLKNREKIRELMQKPFIKGEIALSNEIKLYIEATDSLFDHHLSLTKYINDKKYMQDVKFTEAKRMLYQLSSDFYNCHQLSKKLYEKMEQLYFEKMPLNKLQPSITSTEKELKKVVAELDLWEQELLIGNSSNNEKHNETIRSLHDFGIVKDTFYLKNTDGFGAYSNGWYPHSRYHSFYLSLPGNIYHYSSAKINWPESYLKESDLYYNKFLLSYNQVMDSYNNFIELADGKTWVEESECCPTPKAIQLHENVMLNKPRLLYLFSYLELVSDIKPEVKTEPKITRNTTKNDTAEVKTTLIVDNNLSHKEMIDKAKPHHLIYLLDASTSMNEKGRMQNLKREASYLVKLQRVEDRISILSFASNTTILLENKPCDLKEEINKSIDAIHPIGSTNVEDGIAKASTLAENNPIANGVTKIMLFTDGQFTIKRETVELIKKLKTEGISFCVIYLGPRMNSKMKKDFLTLTKNTNARFYDTNEVDLKEVLVKEASE